MIESASAAPAALSGRRVALLGGFLLLGVFAFVVWLLLSASPASAQSGDSRTTPDGSTSQPEPPESPSPPDDSTALPLPVDVPALMQQTLEPVTDAVLPPLQPGASNVVDALPAPVRAPIASLVARVSSPPSAAPTNPPSGGSGAGDPATSAATTAHTASERAGLHAHRSGQLRSAELSSPGDGTRAPPTGVPAGVAVSGSSVSSSPTPESGSSLLLVGVLIAGIVVLLGCGRHLLIEALAWLPAPWCAVPERPG